MKSSFIWAAIAVFLFVVGMSLYLNLLATHKAECLSKDSPIKIVRSGLAIEQSAKDFAARYEKIGYTCTVRLARIKF